MHIGDAQASVRTTKSQVRSETRTTLKAAVDAFRVSHDDWALAISLAEEKGASSWLTCRPISRHGFALSKAEFRDGWFVLLFVVVRGVIKYDHSWFFKLR